MSLLELSVQLKRVVSSSTVVLVRPVGAVSAGVVMVAVLLKAVRSKVFEAFILRPLTWKL